MEQLIQASKVPTVEEWGMDIHMKRNLLSMLQGVGGFIGWLVMKR